MTTDNSSVDTQPVQVEPLLEMTYRIMTNRLVMLGMAVLQDDFDFTPEQLVRWAELLGERVKETPEYQLGIKGK